MSRTRVKKRTVRARARMNFRRVTIDLMLVVFRVLGV
jgi:hypothetical protein